MARAWSSVDERSHERGFTLVEVLVAMAVLSLAVLAMLRLSGAHLQTAAALEEATLTGIAADNMLAAALLSPTPPAIGEAQVTADVAGTRYAGVQVTDRTAVSGLLIVTVTAVGRDGRTVVAEGLRNSAT